MKGLIVVLVGVMGTAVAQDYPKPTPTMQAQIDKDNGRGFGDSPADPGPFAKDLSPALKVADVDKAIRKVADWELPRVVAHGDQIWTSSVDYVGFMAASRATDPASGGRDTIPSRTR